MTPKKHLDRCWSLEWRGQGQLTTNPFAPVLTVKPMDPPVLPQSGRGGTAVACSAYEESMRWRRHNVFIIDCVTFCGGRRSNDNKVYGFSLLWEGCSMQFNQEFDASFATLVQKMLVKWADQIFGDGEHRM